MPKSKVEFGLLPMSELDTQLSLILKENSSNVVYFLFIFGEDGSRIKRKEVSI
jgi:hypothetical protein